MQDTTPPPTELELPLDPKDPAADKLARALLCVVNEHNLETDSGLSGIVVLLMAVARREGRSPREVLLNVESYVDKLARGELEFRRRRAIDA